MYIVPLGGDFSVSGPAPHKHVRGQKGNLSLGCARLKMKKEGRREGGKEEEGREGEKEGGKREGMGAQLF